MKEVEEERKRMGRKGSEGGRTSRMGRPTTHCNDRLRFSDDFVPQSLHFPMVEARQSPSQR